MNDFVLQVPTKIYFGKDQLKHLPEEVLQYGKKALLVYGGGSIKKIGLYDKVVKLLEDAGITIYELAGVEPNPRHTTVNKGAAICKENNIDFIVAVGGGSVIDCAKAIAGVVKSDTDDVWDFVEKKCDITGALPLFVILTISATGSEMDKWSVISNEDINAKRGLGSEFFFPKASFLNPEFTYSVSPYQTAAGSVDIMAHIIDNYYFTKNPAMEMIHNIQEEVMRTVVKYAPIALKEPDNYEARANLMWASTWALNDYLKAGVSMHTSNHSMEHPLSAYYDMTHGHGLAILIPRWLEYVMQKDPETIPIVARFGRNVFNVDQNLSDEEAGKKTVEVVSDFYFNTLGLPGKLSDLGVDETHFKEMAKKAMKGDSIQGFIELDEEDVINIYKMCL